MIALGAVVCILLLEVDTSSNIEVSLEVPNCYDYDCSRLIDAPCCCQNYLGRNWCCTCENAQRLTKYHETKLWQEFVLRIIAIGIVICLVVLMFAFWDLTWMIFIQPRWRKQRVVKDSAPQKMIGRVNSLFDRMPPALHHVATQSDLSDIEVGVEAIESEDETPVNSLDIHPRSILLPPNKSPNKNPFKSVKFECETSI